MYVCFPAAGTLPPRGGGRAEWTDYLSRDGETLNPRRCLTPDRPHPQGCRRLTKMIAEPPGAAVLCSALAIHTGEDENSFGDALHAAEPQLPAQRRGTQLGGDDDADARGAEEAHPAQLQADPLGAFQGLDQRGLRQRGCVEVEVALDAHDHLGTRFAGLGRADAAGDGGDDRTVLGD